MENKQPTDKIGYANAALSFIFLILSLFLLFKSCESKESDPPQSESMLQIQNAHLNNQAKYWQNEANKYRAKANVIKDTIPYYVKRYSGYYDSVIVVSADTCKPILRQYKRMRDITDSLLMWQINWKDSALIAQDSVILAKNGQIKNDTVMLVNAHKAVSDTVKYFDKAIKRRGFKRFVQGMAIGAAIVEGVNVVKSIKN